METPAGSTESSPAQIAATPPQVPFYKKTPVLIAVCLIAGFILFIPFFFFLRSEVKKTPGEKISPTPTSVTATVPLKTQCDPVTGNTTGQYVFLDASKSAVSCIPPKTIPLAINWVPFTDSAVGYTLEVPEGWQRGQNTVLGHYFFEPSVSQKDVDTFEAPYMVVGWSPMGGRDLQAEIGSVPAKMTPITQGGLTGDLFTVNFGGDKKDILARFLYKNGHVVIHGQIDTADNFYVFQHMLQTFKFLQ